MVESVDRESGSWWGSFRVPEEQALRWVIGPCHFWAKRIHGGWQLSHHSEGDPLSSALEVARPDATDDRPAGVRAERFADEGQGTQITLWPALADRSIVARPLDPFSVLASRNVVLYVSSPLWVRVEAGDPPQRLTEFAIHRPSDTWFGSSTVTGELCYASRTACRMKLEDLPFRPHRAVTAVRIRNHLAVPLLIDRLAVPVANLGLFADPEGHLWTESITFTREDEKEGLARLTIDEGPPAAATHAKRLVAPREKPESKGLVRAFSALL